MHDLTFPLRWRVAPVAPALAVFLAFWLLPMAALVQLSANGHFIATYQALLTNGRYMTSLLQTVLLSAGRIEQIGTPREIYYRPASRAVAQFVGTLNRIAGQWSDGMLRTTGGAVRASASQATGTNELYFRPEDATLADPAIAALRGVIEQSTFLGERTRLTIGGAAPDALIVDVAGRIELARGTPVGIAIAPDALIALA